MQYNLSKVKNNKDGSSCSTINQIGHQIINMGLVAVQLIKGHQVTNKGLVAVQYRPSLHLEY